MSCLGSNNQVRYLAKLMHLTSARTCFYPKHAKLLSFLHSLEVSLGLPSTVVIQLTTFWALGSCS